MSQSAKPRCTGKIAATGNHNDWKYGSAAAGPGMAAILFLMALIALPCNAYVSSGTSTVLLNTYPAFR